MKRLEEALREAASRTDIDLDARRLRADAERALRVNAESVEAAHGPFLRAVADDAKLLIALMGWEPIERQAAEYLRACCEPSRLSPGASPGNPDRHIDDDRPTPCSGAGSQRLSESQRIDDPGAPFPGGESQRTDESHWPLDLSATQQESTGRDQATLVSQSAYDRPAGSPTSMTRRGAAKVTAGIWEVEIGGPARRLGNLTRKDVINAERSAIITAHACRRLLTELAWPDNTTPLRAFASPEEVEQIRESALAALPRPPEDARHE